MKRQQVVIIHGGEAFDTREDYLAFLRHAPYDPHEVRVDDWKKNLPLALGERYEVIAPMMPCKQNAHYDEWVIWFEKLITYFQEGVVLVGHSLGANFLVKYMAEHVLPVRVGSLYLVAGCFGAPGGFQLPAVLSRVTGQIPLVKIYHSHDDQIVLFSHAEAYQAALPGAMLVSFEHRSHFFDPTFPELVNDIQRV